MSLYAAKCSRSFPSNKLTVIKMDDPPALKGPFPVPITPLARVDTGSLTVSHLRVTPVMFFHHSGVFTLRVFTEGDLVTLTNKSSSIYLDITFSREVSCETWAWNLACKGAFSPACSVRFWSYARFSPQAQEIRRFWKGRTLFCACGSRHWTWGTCPLRGRRTTSCTLLKTVAGVDANETLFQKAFFVASAVFSEF